MSDSSAPLLRWAAEAGAQAAPLFAVLLVLVLIACWAGWRLALRYAAPRETGQAPSAWMLISRLALGFAAIVIGASVFAEVAEELHAERTLGLADQAFSDAVRLSVTGPLLDVFYALTHLGNTSTLTLLCIAVAVLLTLRGRRWLALGWVLAVLGNAVLNTTLKQIFARVRPVHTDGLVLADGFSFPSGHSSGSVVCYGMLAYVAVRLLPPRWHLPVLLAAAGLAFSIGASRVFLRVHFPSDVLAGFASGTAWLAVCIVSIELTRWARQRARR